MCGIFGINISKDSTIRPHYKKILRSLFILSESRGKEASGFAINNGKEIRFLKTPFPASDLVNSNVFSKEIDNLLGKDSTNFTTIGHSRLVTNGYEHINDNNQPVIKNNLAVIHNGIITNCNELWNKYNDEKKLTELDSELIPTLLYRFNSNSNNFQNTLVSLYNEIYGMTSIAILGAEMNNLVLATNNGSLYYIQSNDKTGFIFASERYILNKLITDLSLNNLFSLKYITHLAANFSSIVNLTNLQIETRQIDKNLTDFSTLKQTKTLPLIEVTEKISEKNIHLNTSMEYKPVDVPESILKEVNRRKKSIESLKRCTKCILPETFPFIVYDEKGVCNYCNNYRAIQFKGPEEFKNLLESYRSKDGSPDCLMPFSGGRDSSYALHYVKKELGMNPIAFSYDWGMLTDLARRNQARMCGELGIEHILVSADIRKKRENIRKNVLAWLKRPNLGTIPLFMAGDKQYFYFANLLMEQNKLDLSILGENMLETTRFKTGFCGIQPKFDGERTYSLSIEDKLKMLFFYGKEYLLNPAYLNSSLLDTFDAFKSYYVIKHQNINIFDYLPWYENDIESILINEYDWETDPGTKTTWRIGDGTAAFYNYIYYVVAGFTENDTFRSNQIREGLISRENALERTTIENQPRWDSIQWYCNTINIDYNTTINTINTLSTLYEK